MKNLDLKNCQPRILNSGVVVVVQKGTNKIFYSHNGKMYELTTKELGELDTGTHRTQIAFCFPDEIEFREEEVKGPITPGGLWDLD